MLVGCNTKGTQYVMAGFVGYGGISLLNKDSRFRAHTKNPKFQLPTLIVSCRWVKVLSLVLHGEGAKGHQA